MDFRDLAVIAQLKQRPVPVDKDEFDSAEGLWQISLVREASLPLWSYEERKVFVEYMIEIKRPFPRSEWVKELKEFIVWKT